MDPRRSSDGGIGVFVCMAVLNWASSTSTVLFKAALGMVIVLEAIGPRQAPGCGDQARRGWLPLCRCRVIVAGSNLVVLDLAG